jgi:hypothetical protein
MFRGAAEADGGPVLIHVRVEASEPPRGRLWPDRGPVIEFSGWLDLLRVLSELLEEPSSGGTPQAGGP